MLPEMQFDYNVMSATVLSVFDEVQQRPDGVL